MTLTRTSGQGNKRVDVPQSISLNDFGNTPRTHKSGCWLVGVEGKKMGSSVRLPTEAVTMWVLHTLNDCAADYKCDWMLSVWLSPCCQSAEKIVMCVLYKGFSRIKDQKLPLIQRQVCCWWKLSLHVKSLSNSLLVLPKEISEYYSLSVVEISDVLSTARLSSSLVTLDMNNAMQWRQSEGYLWKGKANWADITCN